MEPVSSARSLLILALVLGLGASLAWLWSRSSAGAAYSPDDLELLSHEASPRPPAEGAGPTSEPERPRAAARSAQAPAPRSAALGGPRPGNPREAAQRLEPLAASFLEEGPNIAGMLAWLEDVASWSEVPTQELEANAETKSAQGRFVVKGTTLEGRFRIRGDTCRVSLPSSGYYPAPLVTRDVEIGFRVIEGEVREPWLTVRYHPDANRAAADFLGAVEERRVGWCITFGPKTARGEAFSISTGQGGVWRAGPSQALPRLKPKSGYPTTAFDAWQGLLATWLP